MTTPCRRQHKPASKTIGVMAFIVAVSAPACSALSCETPLERERRELREAGESIDGVVYRGIKVSLRSAPEADFGGLRFPVDGGTVPEPAEASDALGDSDPARKVRTQTQRLFNAMARASDESEGITLSAAEYVELAAAFYSLRHDLRDVDEDEFPTLFEVLSRIQREQRDPTVIQTLSWYNSAWEHLALAALWTASRRAPRGVVIYELGQLDPDELQAVPVRLMSRLLRGVAFVGYDWPYLAELELTAYLEDLEAHREEMSAFTRETQPQLSESQRYAQWHAAGALGRGMVRLVKGEEFEAGMLDDFDAFLDDAQTLGVDQEGVWLVNAYVGIKRDDSPRAIVNLERLAASPLFPEAEQQLFRDAAKAMDERDPEAAFRSVTDKVVVAKVLGAYVLSVLGRVNWEEKLRASKSGRALLRAQHVVSQEIDSIKAGLTPEQVGELGQRAVQQSKGAWQRAWEWLDDEPESPAGSAE